MSATQDIGVSRMGTRGAIVRAVGRDWEVVDLMLDSPQDHEVLIEVRASGLCHSDQHITDGDLEVELPFVGGHEGAGIVRAVGAGVTRVAVGDHVCTSFIPGCGTCRYCARGQSFICNNGYEMEKGLAMDGTPRFFIDGEPIGAQCRLGTFAAHLVTSEQQAIRIDPEIPFDVACLVACGVATGFGAAVNVGQVAPGDVVVILGMGGVGVNAVQGAAIAGASHVIVVDPVAHKRERAPEFGATDTFETLAQALPLIDRHTNGQGADVVIITVGRVDGEIIGEAFSATGKAGTCVLCSLGQNGPGIAISPAELQGLAKSLKGVMFGNCNPATDIPRLLKMYRDGKLKLEELVTRRYALEEINAGFRDLREGRNLRGVLVHDHADATAARAIP
jgi:NDMA-dependent alcohol dehydrogenase